jgi:hypothetical protein
MSTETPQVDTLEVAKDKFINLISELNDTQFHSFEEFVQTALRKSIQKKTTSN